MREIRRSQMLILTMLLLVLAPTKAVFADPFCAICFFDDNYQTYRCRSNQQQTGWCNCAGGPSGCVLGNPCAPHVGCFEDPSAGKLLIPKQMILDVAKDHPRLAIALLLLQRNGFDENGTRLLVPPVEIDSQYVNMLLSSEGQRLRSLEHFVKRESETAYNVSMERRGTAETSIIRIRAISGSSDDISNDLEVYLTHSDPPAIAKAEAKSWQVVPNTVSLFSLLPYLEIQKEPEWLGIAGVQPSSRRH